MSTYDPIQLSRVIQAVEPSARLVSSRFIRRVIRWHFNLSSGARAPHALCFEIAREELLESGYALDIGDSLPERVLLLPVPDDDDESSSERVLLDLWRRLFHARVDRAIDQKGSRIADNPVLFNATVRHEIRTVLMGEHRLPPPEDDKTLYREFAAFFLELKFFAPHSIEVYFPGFLHPDVVARFVENGIEAQLLFDATRPVGAPQPGLAMHEERKSEPATAVPAIIAEDAAAQALAASAAEKGNDVRAGIRYRQLGKVTDAEGRLQHLAERLRIPLSRNDADSSTTYAVLRPLLEPASQGYWPVAGRLLYELQKACIDVERKVYAVDLVECVVSFFKQPVKRLLSKRRDVNVLRRLRAALYYAERVSLSIDQRESLVKLLQAAIGVTVRRIGHDNRPILVEVLDEVGLVPENQAERIARDKMVDELIDLLCARGFLKMSDLRDAIARNRLKLNDLTGPAELVLGDPIIRANRFLALRMDGIYRRGEIYMRGLQRLTSLAFGTLPGRLLTKFAILPFGGAFVLLEGLHHFIEAIEGLVHLVVGHQPPGNAIGEVATIVQDPSSMDSAWTSPYTIAIVGIFLLCLIHLPTFRRRVGKVARTVLLDVPSAIYHSPILRGFFDNRITYLFARYLLTPLLIGGLAGLCLRLLGEGWDATLIASGGVALLSGTLFRTPAGRGLEERFDEVMSRVWRIISVNFIIGVLTLILSFFRAFFELLERGMYAVDEWLRFREGESSASFVFKLVFGTFWFFFAYTFRFAWNLLIEPQINPIKHFPVVTVSHKLLLPMVPSLAKSFELSLPTTTTIVSGIPGIFGFLVWECKENWKVYKANRSPVISPVQVGSHGERVHGLLRPGFHSGVVPKQFAKLRKAETAGDHKKAAKIHHYLDHVAEAVHHLAQRLLIAYLKTSRRWGGLPIHAEKIRLSTNRLRIPLTIQHWEGRVVISIEERSGYLIGSVEEPDWIGKLTDKQRSAFTDALSALYKLSGVHLLREQAAAILGIEKHRLDCRPEGLVVLPKYVGEEVFLDRDDAPEMVASAPIDGRPPTPIPVGDLLLTETPIEWQKWVERWEADHAGKAPLEPMLGRWRVVG